MGNVVALFLFSSRNSILLYLTDWSYSTYLLLHRWLGYWAVLHTIIHSAMLWKYYVKAGSYSAEILRLYWQWGIVGTVAVCAILPFSLLKIRQKFYEFFIISHIVLSLLFLLGFYYHIWYVYQQDLPCLGLNLAYSVAQNLIDPVNVCCEHRRLLGSGGGSNQIRIMPVL